MYFNKRYISIFFSNILNDSLSIFEFIIFFSYSEYVRIWTSMPNEFFYQSIHSLLNNFFHCYSSHEIHLKFLFTYWFHELHQTICSNIYFNFNFIEKSEIAKYYFIKSFNRVDAINNVTWMNNIFNFCLLMSIIINYYTSLNILNYSHR